MRILVLNYEYPPLGGGAAPVCQQLCRHFARRGHEVDVVTMAFKNLPRREHDAGVEIARVPALRRKQATCETHEMLSYVLSAWPRVSWRLSRRPYDIIHCHFLIPTGLLAYLATFGRRIPYVLTAHGSDVPGHNPDRFKKEHRITTPLIRGIMRRAAVTTSPSLYLRDRILEVCGPFNVEHIPNGIDVTRLTPKPKLRRVLMTGRLLPLKGFQHVLEAAKDLETDFEFHIAGDGPYRSGLEALAKSVRPKVVFHGWLNNDSPLLRDLYETSSIFCLPSECENASIALLEAMLAGMAVITSNSAGCPESIGDAGIVLSPKDPAAVRTALQNLIANPALCADLGAKARQRVLDTFDWNQIGDRYLDLFERIVARL